MKGKEATVWDLDGKDSKSLDYSSKGPSSSAGISSFRPDFLPDQSQVCFEFLHNHSISR